MSTKRDRNHLKTYFETGDRPTEEEFAELIDSVLNQKEDDIHTDGNKNIGIGTELPDAKLQVDGNTHVNQDLQVDGKIHGDDTNLGSLQVSASKNGDVDGSTFHMLRSGNAGTNPGGISFVAAGDGVKNGFEFIHKNQNDNSYEQSVRIDGKGNVGVQTANPQSELQVGNGIKSLNVGSAYGASMGWGSSYIGFNAARSNGNWLVSTDNANNGGAVIHANVGGDLFFSTIPRSADNIDAKQDQQLSDSDVLSSKKMMIARNGNVGIGTDDPKEKLHVGGHTFIANDASLNPNTASVLEVNALSGPGISIVTEHNDVLNFHDTSGKDTPFTIKANGNRGIRFHNDTSETMRIQRNGNVGIGINDPQNRLHIISPDGSDTGLTLSGQSGINNGDILSTDGTGKVKWVPKTDVTNGLWRELGNNHIGNGNTGNVGIGTNSPDEKLHVSGNVKIEGVVSGNDQWNKLNIQAGEHPNNPGAYISLRTTNYNDINKGGIVFGARRSGDRSNGFVFLQHNPGEASEWPRCLTIDGEKDSYFWNNKIYLRNEGDKNHGLAHFGDTNENFAGIDVDGPVLFGHSGGALGSNQNGNKKIAMQWFNDGSVDFKNNIRINGHYPMYYQRFEIGDDGNSNHGTNKYFSDYGAAIVMGFAAVNGKIDNGQYFDFYCYTFLDNNDQWVIRADFDSVNKKHENWYVNVLFLRKELVGHHTRPDFIHGTD